MSKESLIEKIKKARPVNPVTEYDSGYSHGLDYAEEIIMGDASTRKDEPIDILGAAHRISCLDNTVFRNTTENCLILAKYALGIKR